MKAYEPVKLEVIDFRADDVVRTSGDLVLAEGVYEHVSDLSSKKDWF